jgi:hypothetical protein
MVDTKKIEKLLKKVEACKKGLVDLSSDEDLSVAIMNLISLEEHFFFTGAKTGKNNYFDLLDTVRAVRKELLAHIVKDPEGEVWCISKHLLASSMRLIEVGTKQQAQGKKEEAERFFTRAYELYSLFWGINLKIIDIGEVSFAAPADVAPADPKNMPELPRPSFLRKLRMLIKDIINCCIE